MYKLKKFISIFLIYTLIFARVFVLLPAIAIDGPPTAPTAPTAPSAPTAPTAPFAQTAPTAPIAPTAPTAPTFTYTAPTAPSVPVLPTSVSQNSTTALPTSSVESTSPTGNTTSPLPTVIDSGSLSPTGSSGDYSSSTGSTSENSGSSSGVINDPVNINTGPASQNAAYENLNKKLEVMNQNLAELKNKVDAVSVSGLNSANFNTLDGQIYTGDVVASTNLLNKLNSNMTGEGGFSVFNVYGNYLSDIVFQMADSGTNGSFSNSTPTVSKNVTTGPGSANLADASNNFTVKEANGNDAKLTNDINLQAVSGGNTASFNTGSGAIQTGNATAVGNVVNMANTNINVASWLWGVVNIFGQMVGNIILPKDTATSGNNIVTPAVYTGNSNTGPLSNNTANYQNTDTTSIESTNSAEMTTNVDISANSGNNTSDANTGGGAVETGSTDVGLNVSNVANTNTVKADETVWMVIVNEAGKWVGHIIGAPWGSSSSSNLLPVSQNENYTTQVTNNGTGPLSDNTSSYIQNSDTAITASNSAVIVNNINVTADTGDNVSSFNTGAGGIKTGDAKAELNVVNMSNTNVVAKKFIAILVNVLGFWLGDVVTPDQQNSSISTSVPVLPTLAPIPTVIPAQQNADSYHPVPIGGTETTGNNLTTFTYYESQSSVNYVYPVAYNQAVNQVNIAKNQVRLQNQKMINGNNSQKAEIVQQARNIKRGLYLSPAFMKATESTFPGILLGGASLKVSNSWLSVVPLAMFIVILRRRKKFNLEKYLNMFLSIVL